MNKKIFMLGIMLVSIAMLAPAKAMAHHDSGAINTDDYNQGWSDGINQAANDWNAHVYTVSSGGNSQCPDGHSDSYCTGWNAGYANEWNRSIQINYGTQQSQDQGAQCNIKGNNNKCEISQGQQANSGDGGGGSSSVPVGRCLAFCSVIH